MRTTSIFKMAVYFLTVISIVACKGNKSGEDNQKTDTEMFAQNSTQFVLKHLDIDKKRIMSYVTGSEQTVDSLLAIADTVYSNTENYKIEST